MSPHHAMQSFKQYLIEGLTNKKYYFKALMSLTAKLWWYQYCARGVTLAIPTAQMKTISTIVQYLQWYIVAWRHFWWGKDVIHKFPWAFCFTNDIHWALEWPWKKTKIKSWINVFFFTFISIVLFLYLCIEAYTIIFITWSYCGGVEKLVYYVS